MTQRPVIAGVELGGTKCIAILASGPDDIRARERIPTHDPETTLAAIEAVLAGWRYDALGIAAFGPLDLDPASPGHGSVVATTKPGWNGAPVLRRLAHGRDVPAAIQTDVNGAALAEGRWGGARGLASHCYVTIGTGVGVGEIAGGRPVQGATHDEAGHMRVPRMAGDGFAGHCPFHGDCVEGLIAGPALAARFGRPAEQLPGDAPEWDVFIHDLAGLVHNLIVTLAPERIAIGGGVMGSHDALFPRLRARVTESIAGYGAFDRYCRELDQRLGPPELGDDAGPLGAIAVGFGAL